MFKLLLTLLLVYPASFFALTGNEIMAAVDRNSVFESLKGSAVMTIHDNGKVRIKNMDLYSRKANSADEFFIMFNNPEDRGVKYLKIAEELWMYLPDADDVMKISGHLLREGMMGSDISYEDMLNDKKMLDSYSNELVGETNFNGSPCYIIEMTAKTNDVTYYKRVAIIDREKMVPLESGLYAKSGRLLKTMVESDLIDLNGKYFPSKMTMKDMRKINSETTIVFRDVDLDAGVPEGVFSLQNLKK